jgi:hypothetical protein
MTRPGGIVVRVIRQHRKEKGMRTTAERIASTTWSLRKLGLSLHRNRDRSFTATDDLFGTADLARVPLEDVEEYAAHIERAVAGVERDSGSGGMVE